MYIYSGLYYLTGNGENIKLAQWIFAVVYLVNLAVVLYIYSRVAKVKSFTLYVHVRVTTWL